MGSSARDVVQSLGDALAGVDRNTEFLKGQQLGADVNLKGSETEAAMALARQRRIEAEVAEAKKVRDDQIAATSTAELADPNSMPMGTLIASGHGADYSGVMEGRLKGQQYGQRQTVGTPAPIGDDMAEAARSAAEDALAPTAAVVSRRPIKPTAPGAPQIVTDPDDPTQNVLIPGTGGSPLQVTTPTGSTTARPTARPASVQPTSQQKNIKALVDMGIEQNTAIGLVMGPKANPEALYNAVVAAQVRNFVKPADAAEAAKEAVRARFGDDAAETAGGTQYVQPEGEQLPRGIPKGSSLIGHTKEGHEVYETSDGKRLVAE